MYLASTVKPTLLSLPNLTPAPRSMQPEDILIVAPLNLQVRCLKARIDARIRWAQWTSSRDRRRRR